jgi:hypothetical protein
MNDLGDVRDSVLEPGVFTSRNAGWVLMDGRNVEGSDLFAINGAANIPDGRGVFIRGMDLGRNAIDGKGDPEGNTRVLNIVQMDEFLAHNHDIRDPGHAHIFRVPNGNGSSGIPGNPQGLEETPTSRSQTGITIELRGGVETRPRNIVLYRYIKINES